MDELLRVENLKVVFEVDEGELTAVDDVSFSLRRGETLGLVGESGCGKSVTAMSLLRLIPSPPGRIVAGQAMFEGRDLLQLPIRELRGVRGRRIGMIFQEPMTALSPVHSIGDQLCEAILLHQDLTEKEAAGRAADMLAKVGIPGPEERLRQYPHELSGGMRQRVVIAMALVCNPELLIADEPTTALDVTIQAQVLRLIKTLQRELGTAVLLITHDLGVVAQIADDVAVMYLGRIVEQSDVRTILKHPRHPYTAGLLQSLPSLHLQKERLPSIKGSVPRLSAIPAGCPFHPRCSFAEPGRCDVGPPPALESLAPGHDAACWRADEIEGSLPAPEREGD